MKEELLDKRQSQIDELDKEISEQKNVNNTLEAKLQGTEKAFQLTK